MKLTEVHVSPIPLQHFDALIGPERAEELHAAAAAGRELLSHRTVWNINSTAAGGGVAEMLQPLLSYSRGAGINARWLVMGGDPEFFRITKRIHNGIHGSAGDRGPLGQHEHAHYGEVARANAEELAAVVSPGDIVLLHDPQTAGLAPHMHDAGALTIWRCHIGADVSNEHVERSWAFLRPYLEAAHAYVFTRSAYVPDFLRSARVYIIPPSIDPFSPKNQEMDDKSVLGILAHVGVTAGVDDHLSSEFLRRDGTPDRVNHRADIIRNGPPPSPDQPLVVQVSRWDRLKDMCGVMHGFAEYVDGSSDAHLALVGPNVSGVADDPEGSEVLQECTQAWRELPHAARGRVQLVCLPMDDLEENAAIVNALQRHATVVVQKSLAEGFGLTVAEAMWKARPVVASAVGGIQDQIADGEHGLLVRDPGDLQGFGERVRSLLEDPDLARRLGSAAKDRARHQFLGTRHLLQYGNMLAELL